MKNFAIGLMVALAFLAFAGESKAACPAGVTFDAFGNPVVVEAGAFLDPFLIGQAGLNVRRGAFRGAPIRRAAKVGARARGRVGRRR